MALTLLLVALVAASGLLACLWGARGPQNLAHNLAFYIGGLVGLWAALGVILLGVGYGLSLGLNP